MKDIKEQIPINPLQITFVAIFLLYIISAILDPFDSFSALAIFVLIALAGYSIANILFSVVPGSMSVSERIINAAHSVVILMFTTVSISLAMVKPMFSIEIIMHFLIISFFIIGGIYIVLGLINLGFPKWFRRSSLFFGLITLIFSLIAILFPLLGFTLLMIIITILMIMMKSLELDSTR
jgi:hypothetical protein